MKYFISTFYNTRYFQPHQIGISTAVFQPKYWKYEQNKNGAVMGICEPLLSPAKLSEEVICQRDCQHKNENPNCPFLVSYREYLETIDFKKLIVELERIANEVKKINNYQQEPEIVLLVYEAVNNPCSERLSLVKLFADHGIELKEWTKDRSGLIF